MCGFCDGWGGGRDVDYLMAGVIVSLHKFFPRLFRFFKALKPPEEFGFSINNTICFPFLELLIPADAPDTGSTILICLSLLDTVQHAQLESSGLIPDYLCLSIYQSIDLFSPLAFWTAVGAICWSLHNVPTVASPFVDWLATFIPLVRFPQRRKMTSPPPTYITVIILLAATGLDLASDEITTCYPYNLSADASTSP